MLFRSRERAVSSLDAEDILAFARFLMFPPADWVGPRRRTIVKGGPGWRPLAGPASDDNVEGVLNVVQGFYRFLVMHKYILEDPLDSFRRIRVAIEGERSDAVTSGMLAEVGSADSSGPRAGVERKLDRVHLVALFAGLTALPGPRPDGEKHPEQLRVWQLLSDPDRNERAWFLLHALLYGTPRVTELAKARMSDLELREIGRAHV